MSRVCWRSWYTVSTPCHPDTSPANSRSKCVNERLRGSSDMPGQVGRNRASTAPNTAFAELTCTVLVTSKSLRRVLFIVKSPACPRRFPVEAPTGGLNPSLGRTPLPVPRRGAHFAPPAGSCKRGCARLSVDPQAAELAADMTIEHQRAAHESQHQ